MEPAVIQLKEMVASSDNIVFFGGAGVSTESGIPDSVDTPAPPKNTMLSLASVSSFSLRMVSSILSLHFFCKEHTL